MKNFTLLILALLLIAGCSTNKSDTDNSGSQDHQIMSVLWFQKSAEMRAIFYQSYYLARIAMDQNLLKVEKGKRAAVILDIDETVLDNSPNQANLILTEQDHNSANWKEWTDLAEAEALPGVKGFLDHAVSKGVEIFYVSNRDSAASFETTLNNLRAKELPSADAEHLLLKTTVSSKEPRRNFIAQNYEIILLLGDNLADLEEVFEKRGDDLGFSDTDSRADLFGTKYIVLPNPMYGSWTSPVSAGSTATTTKEKMREALKGY